MLADTVTKRPVKPGEVFLKVWEKLRRRLA
jgi:hypothetical protein